MVCVIAAGNSGYDGISVPADSFYGISVGAIDDQFNRAYFSSIGPTYDNRIKPEVYIFINFRLLL
jgi:serine protease AprX